MGHMLRTQSAAARPHPAPFNELVINVWLSIDSASSAVVLVLSAMILMDTIPLRLSAVNREYRLLNHVHRTSSQEC